MLKVEHIGIAVHSLKVSIPLFEKLLNSDCYKQEKVDSEAVETAFFKQGDTKIELVAATSDLSPIHKFISKQGEGIHHLAFEVENIELEMSRLKNEGFILLN